MTPADAPDPDAFARRLWLAWHRGEPGTTWERLSEERRENWRAVAAEASPALTVEPAAPARPLCQACWGSPGVLSCTGCGKGYPARATASIADADLSTDQLIARGVAQGRLARGLPLNEHEYALVTANDAPAPPADVLTAAKLEAIEARAAERAASMGESAGPYTQALDIKSAADVPALLRSHRAIAANLAADLREADRLRHGVAVEGDHVCPGDVRADDLAAKVDVAKAAIRGLHVELRAAIDHKEAAERERDAARAEVERLRGIYLSAVHGRGEFRDALREARAEAAGLRGQVAEARAALAAAPADRRVVAALALLVPLAAQMDGCDLGARLAAVVAALGDVAPATPEPTPPPAHPVQPWQVRGGG